MKKEKNIRVWIGAFLLIALFLAPFLPSMQKYVSIPSDIVTLNNESPIEMPVLGDTVSVDTDEESIHAMDSSTFLPLESGDSQLTYKLAGVPIKKVNLSVLEDKKIIPGGQSVGIQLHTLGVLVVGHHLVNSDEGETSPGEEADINVGDIIVKINDQEINDMKEVKPFVEKAGKNGDALDVTLKRGNEEVKTTLTPAMNNEQEYKIGLYIRDSAAGIGTMTFFDPETKYYGALGHVISDMDTKKPIEIHEGTIVGSSVTSIEKGGTGTPGEKQAKFSMNENKFGSVTKNSPFGVFGELDKPLTNDKYDKPMSIALAHEVKEGPAKILTVIDGEKVEEFDVKVVSSIPQKTPATKGMVIQITDPELLKATGGIVQGMSGSPIIQNDKIIGAVTHVFVNDPTSGYGVHIEWMMQEAGIDVFDHNHVNNVAS